MKRLIAALLLTVLASASVNQSTKASIDPPDSDLSSRVELQLTASPPCSLRPLLPGIFFGKLECDRCCAAASETFTDCSRLKGGSVCNCLRAAYNMCLQSGCGPCQCCADYQRRMEIYSCVE